MDMPLLLPLREVGLDALLLVGGKNASSGELLRALASAGVRVPDGFALTTEAFRHHLRAAGLDKAVHEALSGLDPADTAAVAAAGAGLRRRVADAPLPPTIAAAALAAYARLSAASGESDTDVAVRSSATAEDLPDASFAGQQETYLNVRGCARRSIRAVRDCMASLFTDRAIVYRAERGIRTRRRRALGRRPEDGAQRSGQRRRDLHARHRERLARRGAHDRRVGPRARPSCRGASIPTSSGCTSRRCAQGFRAHRASRARREGRAARLRRRRQARRCDELPGRERDRQAPCSPTTRC